MTRETKIGLLVGLAFIIVVGILLGEHVSSTNEPVPASVAGAGSNVRDGVTTPSADAPPVSVAGAGPPVDAPRSPVPTRADLANPPPPAGTVQGGPGGAAPGPVTIRQRGTPPVAPPPQGTQDGAIADAGQTGRAGGLGELMLRHPEVLVPVDPRIGAPTGTGGSVPRPPAPGPVAPRSYTAEPGDSVSKMATKMYGTNTKANRDLIIRANPSLQPDGNRVIAGKMYLFPNAAALAAAPAPGGGPPAPSPVPAPVLAADATWYTVKENDNLWKIAESQLGNGNAWTTLRDANKDVLRGGETVRPNMRIRIPSRPLASASAN